MSDKAEILAAGLKACADRSPLLYAAHKVNYEQVAELAKTNRVPVAVKADGIDELADLSAKLSQIGRKRPGARCRFKEYEAGFPGPDSHP